MAIIRFDSFSEADSLRYSLDKLFDGMDATRVPAWTRQQNWVPTAEVRETENAVTVQIALPGLKAEDINVHVSQSAVLVSGERLQPDLQRGEHLISSEFLYGKFRRIVPLSIKVKNSEVQADMSDGLLTLLIPKVDEDRNRVVQVKLGQPQVAEEVEIS
ncbi:MAG: Hsp20/alpha crystallin family protein [Cyanobacteria bacterium P01_D01_bin.56]